VENVFSADNVGMARGSGHESSFLCGT
jgi:hypothetical protein